MDMTIADSPALRGSIHPDIVGGIAILEGMAREDVEKCPVDVDWGSSNINNWTFAMHLPSENVAMIHRDHYGLEVGPQIVDIIPGEMYLSAFSPFSEEI